MIVDKETAARIENSKKIVEKTNEKIKEELKRFVDEFNLKIINFCSDYDLSECEIEDIVTDSLEKFNITNLKYQGYRKSLCETSYLIENNIKAILIDNDIDVDDTINRFLLDTRKMMKRFRKDLELTKHDSEIKKSNKICEIVGVDEKFKYISSLIEKLINDMGEMFFIITKLNSNMLTNLPHKKSLNKYLFHYYYLKLLYSIKMINIYLASKYCKKYVFNKRIDYNSIYDEFEEFKK